MGVHCWCPIVGSRHWHTPELGCTDEPVETAEDSRPYECINCLRELCDDERRHGLCPDCIVPAPLSIRALHAAPIPDRPPWEMLRS